MPNVYTFSLSDDVRKALDEVPYGEKSALVDEALRAYFSLHGGAEKEAKPRLKRYPAEEITVEQL